MMPNDYSEDKGSANAGATSASAQAPKLRSGATYPAWRRDMEVWLERHNANGVHTRVVDPTNWKHWVTLMGQWDNEALADAMTVYDVANNAAGSSSNNNTMTSATSASVSATLPEAEAKRRQALTAMVRNSQRVFGALYSALPDDLRTQSQSVPRGCAYLLWHWLEMKFQSTEADTVHELLEQWFTLRQA